MDKSSFENNFMASILPNFLKDSIFIPESIFNEKINVLAYSEMIFNNYQPGKNIVFCKVSESLEFYHLEKTNDIVKILMENFKIPVEKMHYISGFVASHYNKQLYESYCKQFNWIQLNIFSLNNYELLTSSRVKDNEDLYKKFLTEPRIKNKKILCFNRDGKEHRLYIVSELIRRNLLKDSYVSLYLYKDKISTSLIREVLPKSYNTISKTLEENEALMPLTLSLNDDHSNNHIVADDVKHFNDSYFSIVNETKYFKHIGHLDCHWFTEKTFKPISCKHPFILVSRPGSLEQLRILGYKTFSPYIDESYDEIENDEDRLEIIMNEVEKLCRYTNLEWLKFQENVQPILEHNFNMLLKCNMKAINL